MRWAARIALTGLFLLGLLAPAGQTAQLISVRLMLEFFANPDHVPVYVAQEKGFFRNAGLDVRVLEPTDPSQVQALVAAGSVEIGLYSMDNYLIVRTEGLPILAVGSLIQRPLGGLVAIKEHGVERITDLRGKKIGYSVEPIEPLLYSYMLTSSGLKPGEFELVKLEFTALLPALLARRLDAIGAFRNFEPTAVELAGRTPVFFAMEDFGVPNFYQLVFIVSEAYAQRNADLLKRFLAAVERGVLFTLAHPEQAQTLLFKANPRLDDALNRGAYGRTVPLFAGAPCHNDAERWRKFQDFFFDAKLIKLKLPLQQLYTSALLPEGCS